MRMDSVSQRGGVQRQMLDGEPPAHVVAIELARDLLLLLARRRCQTLRVFGFHECGGEQAAEREEFRKPAAAAGANDHDRANPRPPRLARGRKAMVAHREER
jgi:hypothetical protein